MQAMRHTPFRSSLGFALPRQLADAFGRHINAIIYDTSCGTPAFYAYRKLPAMMLAFVEIEEIP